MSPELPHSAWEMLYHLWITSGDILEFVRDPRTSLPMARGLLAERAAPARNLGMGGDGEKVSF